MFQNQHIALIIPALDEEQTIGEVVSAVDRAVVDQVLVVDNGSADATARVAREAGATVLHEPRRGYGSACLTGIAAAPKADVLVFCDGDGSDDPREIPALLQALTGTGTSTDPDAGVDLVIGSRTRGQAEPGALTPVQELGNWLTCTLVHWFWGVRFTDLGPFRAVTRAGLNRLAMADPDFGWTIEMQVKAAQSGLRVREIPVACRVRRGGHSKVSGTVLGSYHAGRRILGYVFEAKARDVLG
jgi:glycosyltransferase involved in cell wall biosynthesis